MSTSSTASPTRLAVDQSNPFTSPEGKAAFRRDAFKISLAGSGDLFAPGEDATLVERRAGVFARELGAVGEVGELLAHRAALLSVRMDKLGERSLLAVEVSKAEARRQFDQDRFDEIEGWIKDLDDPTAHRSAYESLEAIPEGLEYLILTWEKMLEAIRSENIDAIASKRTSLWLGLNEEEADASKSGRTDRVDAELGRLRLKADSLTAATKKVDALRERAAILARFDPSPEATLARRYEAAAERGMYRAMRAIAEVRRAREVVLAPLPRAEPPRPSATPTPQPEPAPLGSFRAETPAAPTPSIRPLPTFVEPTLSDAERRKKRPDPRKLVQGRGSRH